MYKSIQFFFLSAMRCDPGTSFVNTKSQLYIILYLYDSVWHYEVWSTVLGDYLFISAFKTGRELECISFL